MAITRSRSFLTAACVAMAATTMVIVATVTTGTSPTDSAWFWTGAIMAIGTTLTIEPVRDRVSRAADWLLDGFMAFARRRSDLEHKLQAQRHDAIARQATAHRQDRPTMTARWRMCPSI